MMEIIRNISVMKESAKKYMKEGKNIGFVPTMGALHEGHLSLIKRCRQENDIAVVSIFVNPLQFGPSEDYEEYPRDFEGDIEKLKALKVDVLFFPSEKQMYPKGYCTYITVEELSDKLCGAFRKGHFSAVATVVTKLFNIVKPTRAYFGQKDYQQSVIIKKMVKDLNIDVDIVVCPTVREEDGLAMSSRNLYLNKNERKSASCIFKTLCQAEEMLKQGKGFKEIKEFMFKSLISEPLIKEVQYASIYDPQTLNEIELSDINIYKGKEVLLAIAVVIGRARLIDNIIVGIN